jgi:hypothetical protein
VIAKLHRFYGSAPTTTGSWLDVPEWLFSAYDRAQPRIEAEEAQVMLEALVAGSGHMKEDAFNAYQRRLMTTAQGRRYRQTSGVARPRTEEELRGLVSAMGLSGFKVDIKD